MFTIGTADRDRLELIHRLTWNRSDVFSFAAMAPRADKTRKKATGLRKADVVARDLLDRIVHGDPAPGATRFSFTGWMADRVHRRPNTGVGPSP